MSTFSNAVTRPSISLHFGLIWLEVSIIQSCFKVTPIDELWHKHMLSEIIQTQRWCADLKGMASNGFVFRWNMRICMLGCNTQLRLAIDHWRGSDFMQTHTNSHTHIQTYGTCTVFQVWHGRSCALCSCTHSMCRSSVNHLPHQHQVYKLYLFIENINRVHPYAATWAHGYSHTPTRTGHNGQWAQMGPHAEMYTVVLYAW